MSDQNTKQTGLVSFFANRQKAIFFLALALYVVLSLLSFDAKLSTGGDDASYIARANRLVQSGTFPTFQGPLYPIFLSPFVAVFGINLNLLKLLSVALGGGFISLFYFGLKDRINPLVLGFSLLLMAVNSYLIKYASLTYSEIFHLFIQMLFIYYFLKFIDHLNGEDSLIKRDWGQWVLMAFLSLLVVLSKNIGLALVMCVPIFFALRRQFKASVFYVGSFAIVFAAYRFLRDLIWTVESPFSKQGQVFLYKDPYNFSKGKEDIPGFLNRLYENTHIYLSKNFMKILDLREATVTSKIDLISYVLIALFLFAFIRAFRHNKAILFISLLNAFTLGISFVILQTRWDSDRLIILMVPFMVLLLIYALNELIQKMNKKYLGIGIYIMLSLMIVSSLQASLSKVDILTLKKNLRGEKYDGYTTDWVNYLKMSEWVSKNLPDDSYVAVRKQTMSIIFSGGRDFHSIARVPSNDPDSLLQRLRDRNVTHVVMASLRKNPRKKTQFTINTIQRYLYIIEQKYPGTFRKVHTIGGSEPAHLFKIYYPNNVQR